MLFSAFSFFSRAEGKGKAPPTKGKPAWRQAEKMNIPVEHIIPSVLSLREFLNQHRSPLQRKCQLAIRMICLEHKNDMETILRDNRQLKDEMTFELQRVKQRTEEANRILDEHLKKVIEFNKMQKEQQQQQEEEQNQEEDDGEAPMDMATPKKKNGNRSTPHGTPMSTRSRPLSPKTIKQLRRSIGILMKEDNVALNPPQFDETVVPVAPVEAEKEPEVAQEQEAGSAEEPQGQEEEMEEEKEATEQAEEVEQEEEKDETVVHKSRRRKTPQPSANKDESVDSDGNVWKKPKIVQASPEAPVATVADVSTANVTLRRKSRRSSRMKTVENEPTPVTEQESSQPPQQEEQQPIEVDKETVAAAAEKTPTRSNQQRSETPLVFDETMLNDGRLCSTPIQKSRTSGVDGVQDENAMNVTFDLNISAIGKETTRRSKKRTQKLTMAGILEAEE